MAAVTLITTENFCKIVDIKPDRFGQRRLRERAAADLAASVGNDDFALMPIAPTAPGEHGRFDALDALRLRAVVELEQAGMAFATACRFIRGAGIGPSAMFPGTDDYFAANWLEPGGALRRISGTRQELARAMPENPLVATRINLSAVLETIAARAATQLGLRIDGANFVKDLAP